MKKPAAKGRWKYPRPKNNTRYVFIDGRMVPLANHSRLYDEFKKKPPVP